MRVPAEPASAAAARAGLRAELRGRGMPDAVTDDAALVVTELLTNALRHARPLPSEQIDVNWTADDDGVLVRITDGGGMTYPQMLDSEPDDVAGRGLAIVDSLASDWGVEVDPDRVTVWAYVTASRANNRHV
jgi:anti-sigma regulatory factor (Ser/Thr protein kinase)